MNDKNLHETGKTENLILTATPFVNEECGDTMWDDVLKEADDRAKAEKKDQAGLELQMAVCDAQTGQCKVDDTSFGEK